MQIYDKKLNYLLFQIKILDISFENGGHKL